MWIHYYDLRLVWCTKVVDCQLSVCMYIQYMDGNLPTAITHETETTVHCLSVKLGRLEFERVLQITFIVY